MRRNYLQLSGGGATSKVLGGLREILLAHFFGTGNVADAYRASLTMALSPVHLLTSRVIQSCFIPLHTRYQEEDRDRADTLFLSLCAGFLSVAVVLALMLFSFAPLLTRILLPGFDVERAALATSMLRVTAIGVPPYIYCAVLGAVGAAQRDFLIPSLRPGLQNLGMVLLILAAAFWKKPILAASGFAIAYLVLAVVATIHLFRNNRLPTSWSFHRETVHHVWSSLWHLAKPLLLLSAVVECNILVERLVASLIGSGSVAAVDYARFITESAHFLLVVPLGLMGLSYYANLSREEMERKTDRHLALLILLFGPLSAFLFLSGRDVLSVLYLRGQFDASSLLLAEHALRGLSVGLWAFSASYLLQRILNARLQNTTVLAGESIGAAANMIFNFLFYEKLGVLVIGLGASLGVLLSLTYYLARLKLELPLVRQTALVVIAALPLYLLGSWQCGRFGLSLLPVLTLQIAFAGMYWAIVSLVPPRLRNLVTDQLGRRSHDD